MRRAIAPWHAPQIRHAAILEDREALQTEWRTRAVAAQAFESIAVAGTHSHARVKVEARHFRDPRALARTARASLLSRERRAVFREAQIGASNEGQLHACLERRELRRLVRAIFCYALVEKAAAAQPATHALLDARGDVGDVRPRGRGAFSKDDGVVVRAGEDALGPKDVEVDRASRATPLPRRPRSRLLYAAEICQFAVQTDACWRYAAMDGE